MTLARVTAGACGFKPRLVRVACALRGAAQRVHAMNYDRDSALIQPYYVIEEINRLTRGEAIIATGVGQHQMWAAQYFDFRSPRLWLTSGSMGTMGFGLPAAIGAQFAQRERLVIDIDGDASIRMNIGELETVTTYDLPVKVVVLNNCGDGMVKQWQKLFFKGRLSASDKSLHNKDFVKAALADGFKFARAPRQARPTCRGSSRSSSASRAPAFLEVMIDPDAGVYPMVGPGPGLRRDDHRRSHPVAHAGRDQDARRLGDVLGARRPRRLRRAPASPDAGVRHAAQGSAGAQRARRCCSNSIDILSGERTKAMRPSRGGRLMVTPCSIRRPQAA